MKRAYKVAQIIVANNMQHPTELSIDDFSEWFNELSHLDQSVHNTKKVIEYKQEEVIGPSPFARLIFKCARKSVHLSIPIKTFVPVSL